MNICIKASVHQLLLIQKHFPLNEIIPPPFLLFTRIILFTQEETDAMYVK